MVTQGGNAHNSSANDEELSDGAVKLFIDGVKWYSIYSCVLGVVMLIGTYLSITLFNIAAHSQVRLDFLFNLLKSLLQYCRTISPMWIEMVLPIRSLVSYNRITGNLFHCERCDRSITNNEFPLILPAQDYVFVQFTALLLKYSNKFPLLEL